MNVNCGAITIIVIKLRNDTQSQGIPKIKTIRILTDIN